jgi:hypothetical protein
MRHGLEPTALDGSAATRAFEIVAGVDTAQGAIDSSQFGTRRIADALQNFVILPLHGLFAEIGG